MRKLIGSLFFEIASLIINIGLFVCPNKEATNEDNDDYKNEIAELQRRHNRLHFTGSVFPIANLCPHPAANKDYYVVALRNAHDETRTDVYMFTEKELIRAQDRANKNTEDIPNDIGDFDLHVHRTED